LFQIPSQTPTRIKNYFFDWPLHSKRWIRTFKPADQDLCRHLPTNERSYNKEIDPNWRLSWNEVLLFQTDPPVSLRPIIRVDTKYYTTIFAVKNRLFTVRIGPGKVDMVLYDKFMKYTPFGFYNPDHTDKPLVLGQAEMTTFITANDHKVTRL
jgi:hypothetical protein